MARKEDAELQSALDRLTVSGLLFRQGVPPHATYLFKHALVQDAAYGTLLREPRRALHARIAETLETEFVEIAENQPGVVARHYTEAALIEKAVGLWGKAGLRSLERSALVETAEQLAQALTLIATSPTTPGLRREQIELQVALITPLIHSKGYAAPETKAAIEQARLLIEEANARGEPPEDPLLLFSVLYSFWLANYVAGNGDVTCELAQKFLALAEEQAAIVPLVIGHRIVGTTMLYTGGLIQGRAHLDQAIALYDPAARRPLAVRFSQDDRVSSLIRRSEVLWSLGYPQAALADVERALNEAREIGHFASLAFALWGRCWMWIDCGDYAAANRLVDELRDLCEEKGSLFWKASGMLLQGHLLAVTDKGVEAVQMLTSAVTAHRSTGAKIHLPSHHVALTRAYADLCQFDDAWRSIDEAQAVIETTKERWYEAEVNRVAGQIVLKSPKPDAAKAETFLDRALTVARQQQAKSWELRAAMSVARLWRDQGKPQEARDLLAPVYGWFTEGFDTRDLKEAKALLDTLAA